MRAEQHGPVTLHHGDCLDVLKTLPDASVDAVVTDPPYGLEFMGREWDGADGFRRSLNANDAGRDNAFGRTSRTSPEYRTASKARAGMAGTGYTDGANRMDRPSHVGSTNPKCLLCDRWQRGANPCRCDVPEWTQERLVRLHTFQEWCEAWSAECLRVLKPGGHMLAFGGTRTWHRLACAVEDAGFEVRDSLAWLYGSGFPKSLDVSKAIDKAAGAERQVIGVRSTSKGDGGTGNDFLTPNSRAARVEVTIPSTPEAARWHGWGTALKPGFEPVVVARKPLAGTVAANVTRHGTGALNIDGCRLATTDAEKAAINAKHAGMDLAEYDREPGDSLNLSTNPIPLTGAQAHELGRWPANVLLDQSQADELDEQSGMSVSRAGKPRGAANGDGWGMTATGAEYDDQGGASRFFYVAKADSSERVRVDGTAHPTVKPLDLMRWLVRLVTPPGGTVLEPFAGSGTTAEACLLEGFRCIAIEREADYLPLIRQRLNRRRDPVAAVRATGDDGGLFDLLGEGA
jgi:site-specific DNA-methyltransferase (adenine-specific)